MFLFLTVGGASVNAGASLDDELIGGGKKKCKSGERCPSGTYKYCDEFGTDYSCVCYYCR